MTQTDDLLSKLYAQLRNSGDSFSMVYFSDHGLAFKERGKQVQYLAHDDKFQQNFQVPFMVLSSDDKTHRIIKARRSANDFLKFFSQWTGIKAKEIKNDYPFISGKKGRQFTLPTLSYRKSTITILGRIFSILRVSNFCRFVRADALTGLSHGERVQTKKIRHIGRIFYWLTEVIRSGNLRPRSRCQRQRCGYGSAHRRSPEQRFRLG